MMTHIESITPIVKLTLKPFIDWISKINNTQVDNAKVIDAAVLMQSLIEYSDNY